jgi:hypothetical protein
MVFNRQRLKILLALSALAVLAVGLLNERSRNWALRKPSRWSHLTVGDQFTHDLILGSDARRGDMSFFSFELKGRWNVTVLRNDTRSLQVQAQIETDSLTGNGMSVEQNSALDEVRRGLATSVYFTFDSAGALTEARVPAAVGGLAATITQSVAAYVQLVLPERETDSWQVEERDRSGRYQADYKSSGFGKIEKRKLRYVDVPGAAQGLKTEMVRSLALFELDGVGMFGKLELDEVIGASQELMGSMSVTTHFALTRTDQKHDTSKVSSFVAEASQIEGKPIDENTPEPAVYSPGADQARIAGRTFGEIRGRLAVISDDKASEQERVELFSALGARMRRDPTAIDEAANLIATGAPDAEDLIAALGSAGVPAAQRVLSELVGQSEVPMTTRRSALLALSLTPDPSDETIDRLVALIDDPEFGRQAKYGLGSCAFDAREINRDRSLRALTPLFERMDKLGSVSAGPVAAMATDLLTAVGNSGLPEIVPYVQPYLQSDSESLRMAALNALRRVPGSAIDEIMAQSMVRDPSPLVRSGALIATSARPPSPVVVRALDASVRNEKDAQVRSTALRTIVAWLPLEPSFRGTLAWMAEHETDASLREAAVAHLARAAL